MRLSKLEKARRARERAEQAKNPPPRELDLEGLACRIIGAKKLNPTQREFIFCPDEVALYKGPIGCAKTASLAASIILPALLYPGSRWLVARAVFWTLQDTTMKEFMDAFKRLGPGAILDKQEGPPTRVWLASAVPNGEPAEFVFQSLDDPEKLGSTQYTGIALDECVEVDESMADTLPGRLRLKRPGEERPLGPFFLRMACNPPTRSHWVHRKFCGEEDCAPVPWGKLFTPHPDENADNLPPGYYEEKSKGMSLEMKKRLIYGECGPDPYGKGVFTNEFIRSLHVGRLSYLPHLPMIRGWDFGRRRPAVVWAQRTSQGWVNRLACELGNNERLDRFARRILERSALQFPGAAEWFDFCDPHGIQLRDTSDVSSVNVLQGMGLNPRWRDLALDRGLDLMSKGLAELTGGRPRSMYDENGCKLLIEGYEGGYYYAEPRGGGHTMKLLPAKDGTYEHLMDADRYIEANLDLGATFNISDHKRSLRRMRNRSTGY